MISSSRFSADDSLEVLWEDGERAFCRRLRLDGEGGRNTVLAVLLTAERPKPFTLERLAHEYELRDELDSAWAARPLELVREQGRTMLALEDPGGEPLERLVGAPMELGRFLRLAVGIATALGKLHQHGLVHKDIKPANILVNCPDGQVRITGFGIASRLPRERPASDPPEFIAGTLAYMAPEQTGRMNRSIDSRSDLYSLGVTLYQMLTGGLPFTATDPMEWVHCHIARQPVAPSERLENVPAPVSQILMKLLAKAAEDRYQSAAGLQSDLRRCLAAWDGVQGIDDFPVGEHDTPDRLLVPEKLYGRAREVETLLASFDRIVKSGAPELVLVSGYSGVGKSSVVNELHKALVPPRGLFASGKFDQYKRDMPYSTLAQAFQGLTRPLLGGSDSELANWRGALLEALEPNARLMTDLIPELSLIIGDQPPIPELEPQQAQSRFQLVFRRFIGVLAQPEHPLALFLDDLQWLDTATLDLLDDLLTRSDLRHLMLIGAYRDNEVDAAHPLARKLDAIRQAGARVQEIRLMPLARDDLGQLIADALHCAPERAAPLAQLTQDKTAGNPFFAIQFLYALAEEGLLRFDHDAACWSWDLARIRNKGYSDNVVDLMVGKLTRLPAESQQALQLLACLGNVAAAATLSIVLGNPEQQVHAALWPAVHQELVERLEDSYRFVHDRVQEAAYSLIADALRAEVHLRIGRLLMTETSPEKREAAIFEIVGQLNRGAALITGPEERDQVAALNLIAGERAQASTAYASALAYLDAGAALLAEDSWERRHELVFAIELRRAECEFLTGAFARAEQRLAMLSTRAVTTVQKAGVTCLRVDLYTTLDQSGRAIAVGLDYLRDFGVEWSPHPTEQDVLREYERIWSQLESRTIEELIGLPLMTDPDSLATLDVLTNLVPPAFFTHANLLSLAICRAVNLSLQHGNSDGSCYAYVMLGMISGPHFGDYQAGFRFGRLGYDLVERRGLKRFQARTYVSFGNLVVPWTKHVRQGRDPLRRAFEIANKSGDLTFAAYSCGNLNSNLLAAGDPLVDVQRHAEHGLEFARKARFGLVVDWITPQLALVRTLRGLTATFGSFDDDAFDETRYERHLSGNPALATAECWYWIRKLQARTFAGDYASAVQASAKARPLLWSSPSCFETAEYHFYSALARAVSDQSGPAGRRQEHLDALVAHHRQLQAWAQHCPDNFENRAALVGAEIARIEGRDLDAMRLYEQAIRSARGNAFVQNEAVAYEVAARFYAARGFEEFARVYLRKAHDGYLRWGAEGKVRQLEENDPHLRTEEPTPGPTSTIATSVERLDLATVIKVSQAVTGEIVLEKMLDTLMRTAIAQAGADRGLLILSQGAESRIQAEATTGGDAVRVQLQDEAVTPAVLPEAVLHYVLRTGESVILDDAATQPPFAADPYIRQCHARSILCLPLINRVKLIGVLYLENNLTPRAFAPGRIAVLKLLASQAAISLDNIGLYRELEEREAKIRRLVDANIIGIFIWELDGRILEANDAFLRTLGYDREDLAAGRLRWTELTPPEWCAGDARAVEELQRTAIAQPFEKEFFRKDRSRVCVLIGIASFETPENQGVAFVLDLSQRKRAEEALRDSEEQWRAVFENNPTMYFMIDAAGTIISLNPFGAEQLGYTAAELVGHAVMDIFHEADRAAVERNAAICFQQLGRAMSWECRKVRKDGTIIWVRETARAMPIKGRPVLLVVCEDISERKQAEYLTQQWFENSPNGLAIVGRDYRFQRANRFYEHHWGIPADRIVGMHVAEIRGRAEFERLIEARLDRCFAGDAQEHRYTDWVNTLIGRRFMLASYAPLRPRSEQVEAALVIHSDITEYELAAEALRVAQAELAHMNRVTAMGQLTASIAHEVNQPIAASVTNAQAALRWLNAQLPDLEEVRQALGRIVENGSRAGEVIGGIRALTRKAPVRKDSVAINDAILEVLALTRGEAIKNDVSVRAQLAEGLPPIEGDRVQLQQVILNLIVNAIEAMSGMDGAPRELLVSTENAGPDAVRVAVRDSGPGLAPATLERLFDAFHTTKPSGLGLGLSICRSIIEAHGGRLLASANVPRGAVFEFTVPAHSAHS